MHLIFIPLLEAQILRQPVMFSTFATTSQSGTAIVAQRCGCAGNARANLRSSAGVGFLVDVCGDQLSTSKNMSYSAAISASATISSSDLMNSHASASSIGSMSPPTARSQVPHREGTCDSVQLESIPSLIFRRAVAVDHFACDRLIVATDREYQNYMFLVAKSGELSLPSRYCQVEVSERFAAVVITWSSGFAAFLVDHYCHS